MKKILTLCALVGTFVCSIFPAYAQKGVRAEAAYDVLRRISGKADLPVELQLEKGSGAAKGKTYFRYEAKDNKLKITGNTPVSLCRGFYDYVKSHHCGLYSWTGCNIRIPAELPAAPEKQVVSPFRHHYMFNVVTYGYSMPYWDWERWEQEIDWMALHGVDMPLALVSYEAILARVWKKMGLTDEEINKYFVGPAHLPWMRMGNISGIDGPLNDDWHKRQIALQHKILKRMKELGMTPICPAFSGFIPEAFKRLYPQLEIVQTHWAGAFSNWMISPEEPLFSQIATAFIREWEKEYGKHYYYLADSFNEMEIPFPEKGSPKRYELLASYGDKVYRAMRKANPDAVWTMQGWMFGYQRHIWDYETLGALTSKVPDDKMLLLDLAVDYNKHFWHSEVNWEFYKGFYNKRWVYSVIPNMGGKTGMTGVLDFYANGHLEALASPNKGRLEAHGMAPEGIENNEVIYELLADAGWSDKETDIDEWLKNYSRNRYGDCPAEVRKCWELLLKSVYGTFTDHPRYNWQFRPGRVRNGSINMNEDFFKAMESFAAAGNALRDHPLYMADLSEYTALYLGAKVELLVKAIDWQYEIGDTARAEKFEKDFEHLMKGMDRLLSVHPTLRLDRWVDYARRQADTPEQRLQYEKNARRIVTIWGPPVDDYSARVWAGLIRDYYLPRWKHYFDSRKTGRPFDFGKWEAKWVETEGLSVAETPADVLNEARALMDYAAFITPALVPGDGRDVIGTWTLDAASEEVLSFEVPAGKLSAIYAIQIERKDGEGAVDCADVVLEADGTEIMSLSEEIVLQGKKKSRTCLVTLPDNVRGNNGVKLRMRMKNRGAAVASGRVLLLKKQ